jgi:hypothetical protein
LSRQRNGNDGCRGTNITDNGENIVFFNQLPHIRRGASRFVAIIERNEPQLTAIHASDAVFSFQADQDAFLHISAQVRSSARQDGGHTEDNFG